MHHDIVRKDLLEIGWLLISRAPGEGMDEAAVARSEVLRQLSALFPEFNWVMPEASLKIPDYEDRIAPTTLIELAERERDRNGWDFVLAITDADLESYLKSYTVGTPSRALGVAVLSTARLSERPSSTASDRHAGILRHRVAALALHLFGDLNGLDHEETPDDYMKVPDSVDDFDQMTRYGEQGLARLRESLASVADPRLEEKDWRHGNTARFYVRAVFQNRRAVFDAVLRSRPWQFPLRLSKLTTAAASTMTVLLISAEAWELGMTQQAATVLSLSILALVLTSLFVIRRQRLLLRRHRRGLSEQHAASVVSVVLSVLLGMLTTYVLLFAVTLGLSLTLFRADVVSEWAAALDGDVGTNHYLILSGFVATLGLAIGALGATFETNEYFRHIALVDEET